MCCADRLFDRLAAHGACADRSSMLFLEACVTLFSQDGARVSPLSHDWTNRRTSGGAWVLPPLFHRPGVDTPEVTRPPAAFKSPSLSQESGRNRRTFSAVTSLLDLSFVLSFDRMRGLGVVVDEDQVADAGRMSVKMSSMRSIF